MPKNKLPEIKTDKVTHVSTNAWIFELISDDYELMGFLNHFQFLFGGLSKNKGIHLSQREISEHMGKSQRYVKYKLAELVNLGILSYARKSTHPRAGGVYFINVEKQGQFDARADACKNQDTRVKPVEQQMDEVLDDSFNFAEECMTVAVDAGKVFLNPKDGIQVRDYVYLELLNETASVAQVINAVAFLRQNALPIKEENWKLAINEPLTLTEAQKVAARRKQQELAGDR